MTNGAVRCPQDSCGNDSRFNRYCRTAHAVWLECSDCHHIFEVREEKLEHLKREFENDLPKS